MKTASGLFLDLKKQRVVSSIVVTTLLVSFSLLFATLFLMYVLFRMTSMVWPSGGLGIPHIWWAGMSTLIILVSSFSLDRFYKGMESLGKPLRGWFAVTFLLGVIFLLSQWGLWGELKKMGIYADSSVLASIVYGFTWIHGFHIVLGLIFFAALIPLVVGKNPSLEKYFLRLQVASKFWHFLGIVWLLMYVTLFIL